MAVTMFENMLGFSNHLYMFSEEIARTGEQLGNTPQAFSHLSMIRYVVFFTLRSSAALEMCDDGRRCVRTWWVR